MKRPGCIRASFRHMIISEASLECFWVGRLLCPTLSVTLSDFALHITFCVEARA
jgi:hypothetical protein